MPITIDFATRIISISQSEFPLSVEVLQEALRDIEASDEGLLHPPTHVPTRSPASLGATITVELINNYTITPEAGEYTAEFTMGNLIGDVNFSSGVQVVRPLSVAFSAISGLTVAESKALELIRDILSGDQVRDADRLRVWPAGADQAVEAPILDKDVSGGAISAPPIEITERA